MYSAFVHLVLLYFRWEFVTNVTWFQSLFWLCSGQFRIRAFRNISPPCSPFSCSNLFKSWRRTFYIWYFIRWLSHPFFFIRVFVNSTHTHIQLWLWYFLRQGQFSLLFQLNFVILNSFGSPQKTTFPTTNNWSDRNRFASNCRSWTNPKTHELKNLQ